eukprot:14572393-Alexandrium_andersonii.AAC.1
MSASLVGSEMCIRDRAQETAGSDGTRLLPPVLDWLSFCRMFWRWGSVSYTQSDAADDMQCVDLG